MEEKTKKCSSCAEEIKLEAKKCRYCGEIFNKKETKQKSTFKNLILYSFSFIFIIAGLGLLGEMTFYGISIFIVGLGILPQIKSKIKPKLEEKTKMKYWIILLLIFIFGAICSSLGQQKSNIQTEKEKPKEQIKEMSEEEKKLEKIKVEKNIQTLIINSEKWSGGIANKRKLNELINENKSYINKYPNYKGIEDLKKINVELNKDLVNAIKKESYKWKYSTPIDSMTDKKTKIAYIYSNNEISQSFPYSDTDGKLTIRNKNDVLDIIFSIKNGQILDYDKYATLRFDDKKAFKVYINGSADYDSTKVFFSKTSTILENLKNSKKLKVQIELYQEGLNIFEFDIEGLNY